MLMSAIFTAFVFPDHYRLYLSIVSAVGLAISWAIVLVVYRLYFHPLSAFPGPALASATGWYETYYDVYKRGKVVEKLEVLHKRYGGSLSTAWCSDFI